MSYRFSGSYRDWPKMHGKTGPRGVLEARRTDRRMDAEERNSRTPHDRRKAHRERRCGVDHSQDRF